MQSTLLAPQSNAKSNAPLELAFDQYCDTLRGAQNASKSSPQKALNHALSLGLSFNFRNRFGESLLEASARLKAESNCITLMNLGANPFELPQTKDILGMFVRLRPFESFITENLPSALALALRPLSKDQITTEQTRWMLLQNDTHSQLRLWRRGSGWGHLAAASGSLSALRILKAFDIDLITLDSTGSCPLMACAHSKSGNESCAELLMLWGADPWAKNNHGDCPANSMPPHWTGLGARAEAELLRQACSESENRDDRRSGGKSKSL